MSAEQTTQRPVPAVAAVIVQDGKLLLIKRAVEPSKGRWSVPGGSVEWGEPLVEALKREVREETGLEIEVDGLAGVFDLIIPECGESPTTNRSGELAAGRQPPAVSGQQPVVLASSIQYRASSIRRHYVLIDYFAHPTGGPLTPGDDASEVRWVPIDELGKYELSDHLRTRLKEIGVT